MQTNILVLYCYLIKPLYALSCYTCQEGKNVDNPPEIFENDLPNCDSHLESIPERIEVCKEDANSCGVAYVYDIENEGLLFQNFTIRI